MKSNNKDFINLLMDLCYMYKDYARKNEKGRLVSVIDINKINIYLFKDIDLIDRFEISFEDNERDVFTYVCIVLMRILFGSVIIYNKDNVFYNDIDKPYLKLIVNDVDICDKLFRILVVYRNIDIYDTLDRVKKIDRSIDDEFVKNMNKRVNISKRILRLGDNK